MIIASRKCPIATSRSLLIGAQAFIAAGITIGTDAVITAGSMVSRNQPPGMVCGGNPCVPLRNRWPAPAGLPNLNPTPVA